MQGEVVILIKSNLHTHTSYSDGKNTAEEMVQAALARGFVSLGFSDHARHEHDKAAMTPENEMAYRKEIRRLKEKYAGQIEIVLGLEHDGANPDYDLSEYEYIIESIHWLEHGENSAPIDLSGARLQQAIDELYAGDPYAMCRDYFDCVCRSVTEFPCDVVGHIGLVTKFNEHGQMFDSADPRYVKPAMDAVALAAEKDLLVEINTGAMSRGYRTSPYPDAVLLKYLKQLGGRITITSDCHRKDWLDFAFEEAAELARSCGFTENWIWKDGQFRPVAL
jgi:histidinol-phosphatase (PHP family)